MTQAERDRALVEHLATRVMGWRLRPGGIYCADAWAMPSGVFAAPLSWNPLDSWADAGMVLDKVSEQDILFETFHFRHGCGARWAASFCAIPESEVENNSGPRAICEAVGKATGWQEPRT